MTESVTYRDILRKGRVAGKAEGKAEGNAEGELRQAQKSLLLFGSEAYGDPAPEVRKAINQITDLNALEALTRRIVHVQSWTELLEQ